MNSSAAATMPYSMLPSSSATTPKLRATMWRPSAGCAATVKQSGRANAGSGHNGAVDLPATLRQSNLRARCYGGHAENWFGGRRQGERSFAAS
ncbi:Hypothetical protein AT6N2_L0734 [Agrobacterium tumefaciens]|nr:Hypothetical protein AT6N2_L0734 [Agrobacterium tumefaciens]